MGKEYKIFPSIGIARLGNSDEYYLGPDSPDINFLPPDGKYRDENGKIKRLGQKFRIFEFEGGTPIREITSEHAEITWDVHLVNSKTTYYKNSNQGVSSIDTGSQKISGKNAELSMDAKLDTNTNLININLGRLITDNQGHLIILGGKGQSDSWMSPPSVDTLFNKGWYDDTCDGRVTASFKFNNENETIPIDSDAWIIVGPPDFSHPTECIVTLWDLILDTAGRFNSSTSSNKPSFSRDIYPVLMRTCFSQWTCLSVRKGHSSNVAEGNFLDSANFKKLNDKTEGKDLRGKIFSRLKNPVEGGGNMPMLSRLTLTKTQYNYFRQWSEGNYKDDWKSGWNPNDPPKNLYYPELDSIEEKERIKALPYAITQAALNPAVGGSFYPGIEAGINIAKKNNYKSPFRIDSGKVKPGDITRTLSVPWQADFKQCYESPDDAENPYGKWWPSARPNSVFKKNNRIPVPVKWARGIETNMNMVDKWSQLGFIVRDAVSDSYIEKERTLSEE